MAYIYKITNDINDKIYIGKTEFSIEKRFREHCKDSQRKTKEHRPLYSAMRKYGTEHFHISLIEETDNPEEREKYWIKKYGSYHNGYNATLGGDGKKLFNYEKIKQELENNPYPADVARKFHCSPDTVYNIAHLYDIKCKNKGNDNGNGSNVNSPRKIAAYDKQGNFIKDFASVTLAGEWIFNQGLCKTLNSGVRSHISDAALGKRKSAYTFIWQYY